MIKNPFDEEYAARIRGNIARIRENIAQAAEQAGRSPDDVRLMAVTKTVAPEYVNVAVESGVNLLGENRAQELLEKFPVYQPAEIHFIGHLQTNKVKSVIDKVSMIHSLDSVRLAREIDRQAALIEKVMPVLVEVNIGNQESKSGVLPGMLEDFMGQLGSFRNIAVKGLMAIPPAENPQRYFEAMQKLYVDIRGKKMDNIDMQYLSMGMSGDYPVAIRFGANIVRLGSAIFGKRK